MDEVARICTGLRLTRPSINFEQLLSLEEPKPEFEAHVPAEGSGKDAWIYTVNGNAVDGECMVVRASTPWQAESLAQSGLHDTIESLRKFDKNTGLQADVEVRPLQ